MSKGIAVGRAALGAPLRGGDLVLETETQAAATLLPSSRAHGHKIFRGKKNKRKKIPLAHLSRALLHPEPLFGQRGRAPGPLLHRLAAGGSWKVGLRSWGRSPGWEMLWGAHGDRGALVGFGTAVQPRQHPAWFGESLPRSLCRR